MKPINYLIIITILLIINLFLAFYEPTSHLSSFDDELYTIKDTGSIVGITINYKGDSVNLMRKEDGWQLNNQYKVNDYLLSTLLFILHRSRVKQKITNENHLLEQVKNDFGRAKILFQNKHESFEFTSNLLKTKTYFIKDGMTHELEVPGYRENIADIFMLHPDQWRDRLIVNANWRTIKTLALHDGEKENLKIEFVDHFFLINGKEAMDSIEVTEYLNQFQYFEANEMVSLGRFPQLDSLAETIPLAELIIEDIHAAQKLYLNIFPKLPDQSYHLVVKNDQDRMMVDASRINNILKKGQKLIPIQ